MNPAESQFKFNTTDAGGHVSPVHPEEKAVYLDNMMADFGTTKDWEKEYNHDSAAASKWAAEGKRAKFNAARAERANKGKERPIVKVDSTKTVAGKEV